jgi:hypothetical protein
VQEDLAGQAEDRGGAFSSSNRSKPWMRARANAHSAAWLCKGSSALGAGRSSPRSVLRFVELVVTKGHKARSNFLPPATSSGLF